MESFVDDGKVHQIGISNMHDVDKFKTLYSDARIKPWVVQIRFGAETNFDTDLESFLKGTGCQLSKLLDSDSPS